MTKLANAPDLNVGYPRSPREKLGGYVILARAIDKCRATLAEKNGEYIYNCPLDQNLFGFTGVDAEDLKQKVAEGASDEELVQWFRSKAQPHTDDEIQTWNEKYLQNGPETDEQKEHFENMRRQYAPDNPNVTSWADLLDAEEGRL